MDADIGTTLCDRRFGNYIDGNDNNNNSERLQIFFNEDMVHKKGNLADYIYNKARDDLAQYFAENESVPQYPKVSGCTQQS